MGVVFTHNSIRNLLLLMKDTFGDKFKSYYEGDPLQIPAASLPCIIVERQSSQINTDESPTGMDRYIESIRIKLVLDKLDDLNAGDEIDLTDRKLNELVDRIDENTGTYATDTAIYALRSKLTLGSTYVGSSQNINYDIQPRADMQLTSEAYIDVTLTRNIVAPPRS